MFWDPTPFLCLFLLPGCPQVNSFLPPKPSAKAPDLTTMEPASRGLEALRLLTKINYSSVKLCFSGTLSQRQKEMTNKSVQAEIVGLGNTPLKPGKLSSDLSRSYRQREWSPVSLWHMRSWRFREMHWELCGCFEAWKVGCGGDECREVGQATVRQGLAGYALEAGPYGKDSTSPWRFFRRMVGHDQTCWDFELNKITILTNSEGKKWEPIRSRSIRLRMILGEIFKYGSVCKKKKKKCGWAKNGK